jgi:predicted transcriptional regulator
MNVVEIINKNKLLEEELQKTKDELIKTKEHLKKYTAPVSRKAYYETHKEEQKQRVKEYKQIIQIIYQLKKRKNMQEPHI